MPRVPCAVEGLHIQVNDLPLELSLALEALSIAQIAESCMALDRNFANSKCHCGIQPAWWGGSKDIKKSSHNVSTLSARKLGEGGCPALYGHETVMPLFDKYADALSDWLLGQEAEPELHGNGNNAIAKARDKALLYFGIHPEQRRRVVAALPLGARTDFHHRSLLLRC